MIAQIEIFFQVMNYCYIIFSGTKAYTQQLIPKKNKNLFGLNTYVFKQFLTQILKK